MSERFDSIYFIYPVSFKDKSAQNIIDCTYNLVHDGYIISYDKCQVVTPDCTFYSEADMKNIGVDNACELAKKTFNCDSCVLYRVPNHYLGMGNNPENLDISPIMFQICKGDVQRYSIMNNFICGVYSEHTGYVGNTNYSEICGVGGILSDEQKRKVSELTIADDKYQEMLNFDARMRATYPITAEITNDQYKEMREFYMGAQSPFNVTAANYTKDNYAHLMTRAEFMKVVANNMTRGM